MAHSYVVYIDESGDDGLDNFRVPRERGGSSHWLVISATVIRYEQRANIVPWRDAVVSLMPNRQQKRIHFTEMKHGQRLATCQSLAARPIRFINVVSHKGSIPVGTYPNQNQLYFYLTRYLIERVSWFCRDNRIPGDPGDGTARITFSRRGGMSYQDFQAYLTRLKDQPTNIHWGSIDIPSIDAQDHRRDAGLQIADVGASATAAGLEADFFGNCERRYAEILKRKIYAHRGNYLSYGLKIVPDPARLALTDDQRHMVDLFS